MRRGVRPGRWHAEAVRLARRPVHRAPGTGVYLFTLSVTWWTLQGADPGLVRRVLLSQSTNLHNMLEHPVQVLVGSAFWLDGEGFFWLTLAQFLLVMAPAERWLGTARWVLTFAAGHVGASVVTVSGIAWALRHDLLDADVAHTSDVGSSYGFYAVAAVLTGRAAGRRRLAWAATLAVALLVAALVRETFTDYGHLVAAAIGFALGPLVTPRDGAPGGGRPAGPVAAPVRRRAAWPLPTPRAARR